MQETALFQHAPAKKSRPRRQTIHTTLHLKQNIRHQLERVAQQQHLSVSATGAGLLEWALLQNLEMQQGALFERTITRLMRERERAFNNRFAVLLVHLAVEVGQTRELVTNLLPCVPGMTEENAYHTLEASKQAAKKKLQRNFSQFADLITACGTWLNDEQGEQKE